MHGAGMTVEFESQQQKYMLGKIGKCIVFFLALLAINVILRIVSAPTLSE
jgi:hypothetical protein